MAYANITVVASSGQVNFTFPFDYLDRSHIFVFRDGVDEPDFTFVNATTIALDVPADEDSLIKIDRQTPIDEPIVDFVNGSVLGEADLDASAIQSLFAAQETADDFDNSIHLDAALRWDSLGFRIINVGAPVAATDAATKGFADSVLADAQADADAAAASATAADASATAAAASAAEAEANAADLIGTSTTSLAIGTGSKVFTTQAGLFFNPGTWVLAVSDADVANYMHGQVTAYSGTTLTVNVTNVGGSGTLADWTITVSGTRGAIGATGAQGIQGIQGIQGPQGDEGPEGPEGPAGGVSSPSGTVASETAFGVSSSAGVSDDYSRGDHTHGSPTNPITAHEAAADPHTVYQLESEKNQPSGYAGLDASTNIPAGQVATASLEDDAVTFAKMQNITAASKLLGRGDSGSGDPQEITLGTNLTMTGTTLDAAGGSAGDSLTYEFW
jgi:tail fiber protein/uncharacterized protein DUF5907